MQAQTERTPAPARWAELLQHAVNEPGTIAGAYSAFHPYSVGNQMLAMWQCGARGLQVGPIATYPAWQSKGRQVRKGERALTLCMPVTFKRANKSAQNEQTEGEEGEQNDSYVSVFVYRPHWFALSQTEGKPGAPELAAPVLPDWDKARALMSLGIVEEPFRMADGNCMGYARTTARSVAVSPLAFNPHKTLVHELAHVLLHTGEQTDEGALPRSLQEVEAESVALIVCESLGLGELADCRGYIQSWLRGQSIPDKSAQRIFGAADRIFKAGLAVSSSAQMAA